MESGSPVTEVHHHKWLGHGTSARNKRVICKFCRKTKVIKKAVDKRTLRKDRVKDERGRFKGVFSSVLSQELPGHP